MKHISIKLISMLSVVLFCVSAEAGNVCDEKNGFTIEYFNGINNSYSDAVKSMRELRYRIGNYYDGQKIDYDVAYNTSHTILLDLVELYVLRAREKNGGTAPYGTYPYFWSHNIYRNVHYAGKDKRSEEHLFYALQEAERETDKWKSDYLYSQTENELNSMRIKVINELLSSKKVLFVAHSEGNLLANATYDAGSTFVESYYETKPFDSIKVVHVAPASSTLRGPYVLSDVDYVIKYMRGDTPSPNLIAPIESGFFRTIGHWFGWTSPCFPPDSLGHNFVDIYFNPYLGYGCSEKRANSEIPYYRVRGHILNALQELRTPGRKVFTKGFFDVSLYWTRKGDVDLYVTEPSGLVVGPGNRNGDAGRIDADVQKGYGPEHYYARCNEEQVQEGIYRIEAQGYNYSSRYIKGRAIIRSSDGSLEYYTEDKPLSNRRHKTYPRVLMAKVKVSKGKDGKLKVEIVP